MFYSFVLLHWITVFLITLTFEGTYYEQYSLDFRDLNLLVFSICVLLQLNMNSRRAKNIIFLTALYHIYALVIAALIGKLSPIPYMIESLIVFAWTVWIMLRPEISTAKTLNHKNILLAFYKGDKGSFLMNFFELLDLPVKSLSIIAGDKALYLKSKEPMFQYGTSEVITRHAKDYIIVDTGIPYTMDFVLEMKKHSDKTATRGILRVRCVEAVRDLLGMIDDRYKPKSYIPSLYLRQVIR